MKPNLVLSKQKGIIKKLIKCLVFFPIYTSIFWVCVPITSLFKVIPISPHWNIFMWTTGRVVLKYTNKKETKKQIFPGFVLVTVCLKTHLFSLAFDAVSKVVFSIFTRFYFLLNFS